MPDSGLATGGPPLPMAVSTDGLTDRAVPASAMVAVATSPDLLAAFDAFVVLGLLGLYLKVALLAPQWGAVARFFGKQPGEPLGWLNPLGFFASDLVLNLLIIPFVATTIVSFAFGAWRVLVACVVSVVFCLVYFVELRADSEVGQYISGEMLHDFIGWSTMHASSASDYLTTASVIKLFVVLATLCGVLLAARAARRASSRRSRAALRLLLAAPAALAVAAVVVVAPIGYAVRLPNSPLNTSAVTRAATSLMTASKTGDTGSPWLNLDDALGALRRLTHTAPFDRAHALVGQEAGSDLIIMMMETGPSAAFDYSEGRRPPARRRTAASACARLAATLHRAPVQQRRAVRRAVRDLPARTPAAARGPGRPGGERAVLGAAGRRRPARHLPAEPLPDRAGRPDVRGVRRPYPLRRRPPPRRSAARAGGDRAPTPCCATSAATAWTPPSAIGCAPADQRPAGARAPEGGHHPHHRRGGRYAVLFFPEIGHGPWPQLLPRDTTCWPAGGR